MRIVSFEAALHAGSVLDMARRVRAHDPAYPPNDVADTRAAFVAWLASEDYAHRWVAVDEHARVMGHVAVCHAHPYLTGFLAEAGEPHEKVAEIAKLFVDPEQRGRQIGPALLDTAVDYIRAEGLSPALAVLEATPAAVRLYDRVGMRRVGSFAGIHGLNHVYVADPTLAVTVDAPAA